jgi:hypothetical protein
MLSLALDGRRARNRWDWHMDYSVILQDIIHLATDVLTGLNTSGALG